jgi:nitrate reductase gamma subunit
MSIGGATGIIINGGVALGIARPWPPLLLGLLGLLVAWAMRPSATVFASVVLGTQAGTLVICTWFCLWRRRTVRGPAWEPARPDDRLAQQGVLGALPASGPQ